jgi:carboxypeptidase T
MVNPDGHEYTRVHERLWRKNRRPNPDGSFHVPSDETYVGPRAFSEPETRAARDLIARELFRGIITYHSYSQLILYPWGYTNKPTVDRADRDRMINLANRMQQLIHAVHGKTYTVQQSSQLYPTADDTTDWTYGIYGTPSFTTELRPDSLDAGGFILPAAQIQLPGRKTNQQP